MKKIQSVCESSKRRRRKKKLPSTLVIYKLSSRLFAMGGGFPCHFGREKHIFVFISLSRLFDCSTDVCV
jgi:hypothetical protein